MAEYGDFKEIAHCGGRTTFRVVCDAEGRRSCSQAIQGDRPGPAAIVGIYALAPQGIPVSNLAMGGIGQPFEPQPQPGWFPVFLGSDSQQCWGHKCPRCSGYFRNGQHPATYPLTCPYCGLRTAAFRFLTPAQLAYVHHYIETLMDALDEDVPPGGEKEFVIDMDEIADRGSDQPKPEFYYTSQTQQTQYKCDHCGEFNDIRGRFGYCASCGWRNNAQSLKVSFNALRERLNNGLATPAETVNSTVSEFDACCRNMVGEITKRVPMKPNRKADFERSLFHDIDSAAVRSMKSMFDIDLLRGVGAEITFAQMMIHRRHVYTHNGGVADKKYVQESGDPDAREGVLIRETQINAHRLIGVLSRIIENVDCDFHEIFQPTEWPVRHFDEWQARLAKRQNPR
jgi:hypothetical protein